MRLFKFIFGIVISSIYAQGENVNKQNSTEQAKVGKSLVQELKNKNLITITDSRKTEPCIVGRK